MTSTMPVLFATWRARVLAGEVNCLWSYWYRAHYKYRRHPPSFDLAAWRAIHDELVRETAARYRGLGYRAHEEGDNSFTLIWRGGKIKGRPDLVAVKDGRALVLDCKTGVPYAFHVLQMQFYMLILPHTHAEARGLPHDGLVLYRDHEVHSPMSEINADLKARVHHAAALLGGPTPPPRAPSAAECCRCDIGSDDCSDRLEKAHVEIEDNELF